MTELPAPPEASTPLRRAAMRVRAPVEQLLHRETTSGLLLLAMAVIALVWANSPWSESYVHLWHTPITLGFGDFALTKELGHFWINDFLMCFFFMSAGFEIKREMAEGELSDMRRGALPIAAAVGGMLVPALAYVVFNTGGETIHGWGVPMATDIAFALGVLLLLGKRVPAAMRILLLALAIIDDLGAILVIALFYTDGFNIMGMWLVGGGLAILYLFRRLGMRPGLRYTIPLFIIFAGLYQAGVHPTIAGVLVGLSAPVKPWLTKEQFLAISTGVLEDYQAAIKNSTLKEDELIPTLDRLSLAGREAISPVVRLQNEFHPWVSFFIMPVFALANAGVNLSGLSFGDTASLSVMLGIGLGLALGKPIGVLLVSYVLVKLKLVHIPRGVTWGGMLILGLCAGIGFTMAIFIAGLAFKGEPELLTAAKFSILVASAVTGILALVLGRLFLSRDLDPEVAAMTPAQAESSTTY
ncbi:Na+/H+ antiporter NhaA [Haliangium ochraceum]